MSVKRVCNRGHGQCSQRRYGTAAHAPYQPEHYPPLHQNCDGPHEKCGGKFGQTFGGNSQRKNTQNDIMRELLVRFVRSRSVKESIGGGGRSRTYDAADMSRVL